MKSDTYLRAIEKTREIYRRQDNLHDTRDTLTICAVCDHSHQRKISDDFGITFKCRLHDCHTEELIPGEGLAVDFVNWSDTCDEFHMKGATYEHN